MHFTHSSKFLYVFVIGCTVFLTGFSISNIFHYMQVDIWTNIFFSIITQITFLIGFSFIWKATYQEGEKGQHAIVIAKALTDMVPQDEKTAMTFLKKIIATSSGKKFLFLELIHGMPVHLKHHLIPCVWLMQEEVRDREKLTAEDHYKAAQELEHLDWLVLLFKKDLRAYSDIKVDTSACERVKTLERLRAVA